MATRPGLDTAIINRLGADHQEIFLAVKAEFDSGSIRVWTGIDDITISSETYLGAGSLLGISPPKDTSEIVTTGVQVSISGMDETVLSYALTENYQNRPVTIYLGYLSGGTSDVVGTLTVFKGRMVSMSVTDDPEGSIIAIDCENRLIDLRRPSNLRYTKESQEFLHPGDKGFDYIQSLQDKEILWGRSGWGKGNSGGTHDIDEDIGDSDFIR